MNTTIAAAAALTLIVAALWLGYLMHADPMPPPAHFGPTPVPMDVRYWVRLDCCPAQVSSEPVYAPCYH